MIKQTVLGAVVGLALSAGMAAAATIGFTINPGGSSVSLVKTGGACLGCSITAQVVAPASSFQLGTGDTKTFDFLKFTSHGLGTGLISYNVTAKLAFSAPSGADTTGHGSAGGLLVFGSIVGGHLSWSNLPNNVTLGDGSKISVNFEGGLALLEGKSVTTSASVYGKDIKGDGPAPIPVPPAALLLIGGLGSLGGLGLTGRRRKAA